MLLVGMFILWYSLKTERYTALEVGPAGNLVSETYHKCLWMLTPAHSCQFPKRLRVFKEYLLYLFLVEILTQWLCQKKGMFMLGERQLMAN